jgi:BirA family biotin operon repressor/biotin-[acetyl-CoA-carboxylase] ligase
VKGTDYRKRKIEGKDVYLYRSVASTNDIAGEMARRGAAGAIVMSRAQTAGRGRLDRRWFCPAGKGLLLSIVVRPQIDVQHVPLLTLLAGVAVAKTIRQVTGCEAGIKWPNDILVNGKKVCGILAESSISRGAPDYVIIGMGINVNLDRSDLPPDCRNTGTSLKLELGRRVSRLAVLRRLITTWEKHYQGSLRGGPPYIRQEWVENNLTLGRTVTINKGKEAVSGLAVGISERGGLLLRRTSDGVVEEYLAGDVTTEF